MRLGTLTLDLRLPGCYTLKEKRRRLKGVLERIRAKFNVSVSEVDYQDFHQSSLVAVAMVSDEFSIIEQVFQKIETYFENGDGLVVAGSDVEWH